jgi:hypothetical protein
VSSRRDRRDLSDRRRASIPRLLGFGPIEPLFERLNPFVDLLDQQLDS